MNESGDRKPGVRPADGGTRVCDISGAVLIQRCRASVSMKLLVVLNFFIFGPRFHEVRYLSSSRAIRCRLSLYRSWAESLIFQRLIVSDELSTTPSKPRLCPVALIVAGSLPSGSSWFTGLAISLPRPKPSAMRFGGAVWTDSSPVVPMRYREFCSQPGAVIRWPTGCAQAPAPKVVVTASVLMECRLNFAPFDISGMYRRGGWSRN